MLIICISLLINDVELQDNVLVVMNISSLLKGLSKNLPSFLLGVYLLSYS